MSVTYFSDNQICEEGSLSTLVSSKIGLEKMSVVHFKCKRFVFEGY